MKEKVDIKKIQSLAKELIKQGKTKQEVYEELVNTFKYKNIVADIVRYTPTNERLNKYLIWNTLYLIFISLITLLSLIKPSLGIIWLIILIVLVVMKKFKYYYWNTIFGVFTIISVLAWTIYQDINNSNETTLIMLLISIPIALIFIFAGIYLPKAMTPKYNVTKEKYIDKDGKEKLRLIYKFEV